jgi:hypothetical protein
MGSDAATIGPVPAAMAEAPPPSRRWVWLGLLAILAGAALIRIRLLDIPLERDEGEYALAGQLMLHGIPPYKLAWNMKFPGTYAAYAAIMAVLGQSTRAIHLGLLAVNAATTLLLRSLASRWFDAGAALAVCSTFALLSLSPGVLGMAAHATHFVIFFAVAATIVLFRAIDSKSARTVFLSGLLYGIAVPMKQQGIFLALFGAVWLLRTGARMRRMTAFAAGVALPSALTFFVLWKLGVFDTFWFWTFQYAREYASETTLAEGRDILASALPDIVLPSLALWILAGAGLAFLWRTADSRPIALPLTLFLLSSALAVCPGFYFRGHYFILMLPAVALLVGASMHLAGRAGLGAAAASVLAAALAVSLFAQRDFLFRMSPVEASRWEYALNPFPEAIRVADFIRAHTAPGSRVAVLGSEPEICFYADRPPATGYIYTYGLMEDQPFALGMQDEMIREIERARPEYVVDVHIDTSWQQDDNSAKKIFDWWDGYSRNYTRVGLVDMVDANHIRDSWGAEAAGRAPESDSYLLVLRRK